MSIRLTKQLMTKLRASFIGVNVLSTRFLFTNGEARQPRPSHVLMPVTDLNVIRVWSTLPGLEKRLQTHQKNRPFCCAMVHEFHWLFPALVFEKDDGIVPFLF